MADFQVMRRPKFPSGKANENGWRLDIVSLLAVIGESSMDTHIKPLTATWLCLLPRLIPAPQALLKPDLTRPTRLPELKAIVVGVHNGTCFQTLNYFPNILHPIEELEPFEFRVLEITHSEEKPSGDVKGGPDVERGEDEKKAPREPLIPARYDSPLNIVTVISCLWTCGLIVMAAIIGDASAILAVVLISLVSSLVGLASWWKLVLTKRPFKEKVPPGDVVIKTREGAILVVKCNEEVARELYSGTEQCKYAFATDAYRKLASIGTVLLMISVVLLGNCGFIMQTAIGSTYMVLNGVYWALSFQNKQRNWNLSHYIVKPAIPKGTVEDKVTAEGGPKASFTRTLWLAIRETSESKWAKATGIAPNTEAWAKWLDLAKKNAHDEAWPFMGELRKCLANPSTTNASQTNDNAISGGVPSTNTPPQDNQ